MVYLNLSVLCIEESIDFYSRKLELFDFQSDERLIFNAGAEFILDLIESGTERHRVTFGKDEQLISSFRIHIGGMNRSFRYPIFNRLKEKRIQYEEIHNLGGHYLKFTDPSMNKFALHANSGSFQ
jgi:hypothetical protein